MILAPSGKHSALQLYVLLRTKVLSSLERLTIHPSRTCGYDLINLLSKAVDWAVLDTFDRIWPASAAYHCSSAYCCREESR